MIDTLYSWDVAFFFWVNHGWSCAPLNYVFHFFNELKFFMGPIVLFVGYLWIKGGVKGRFLILALLLSVLIADQTAAHVLKPLVMRVRPCNALENVNLPYGGKTSYSFPSNHAANIAAVMLLLSLYFRRWTPVFVVWALMVGLARIYLGHHYPSDVLGGYVIGLAAGGAAGWISQKLMEKWNMRYSGGRSF